MNSLVDEIAAIDMSEMDSLFFERKSSLKVYFISQTRVQKDLNECRVVFSFECGTREVNRLLGPQFWNEISGGCKLGSQRLEQR